MQKQHRLHS